MAIGLQAEQALLQGRAAEARAHLVQREKGPGSTWILPALAAATGELGDVQQAEIIAREAITLAYQQRDLPALSGALRSLGTVFAHGKQWGKCIDTLQAALDLSRNMHFRYGEARALSTLGLAQLSRGHSEKAAESLQEALEVFEQLGAHFEAKHCRNALLTAKQRSHEHSA